MDPLALGNDFKILSRDNLFRSLELIHGDNNLLVISREVSKSLNFLTPFSVLKEKGRITSTLLVDEISSTEKLNPVVKLYKSLIVIVKSDDSGLKELKTLWSFLDQRSPINVNILVQNFSKSFYNSVLLEVVKSSEQTFTACSRVDESASVVRLSKHSRIFPWKVYPMLIHDNILSLDMKNGGIAEYLSNPLQIVSELSDSLIDILSQTAVCESIFKMKNVFAKGDHSCLLAKSFLEQGLPRFLSSQLSYNQQEFYLRKLSGNTDLVVLERNLDYFPLLLSPMNYMGLLDYVFETEDDLNNVLFTKERLDDELYHNIKHLNFGSIGVKLNKLARYIQLEFENSDKSNDLEEIKQLVKNLGSLTSKQDMVRKHTQLSEKILQCIKSDINGEYKFNIMEKWLELQNEVFELEYKQQLKRLFSLIDQCAPFKIVMSLVVLISLINDGVRQNDMVLIKKSIQLNFGLKGALTLENLLNYKILRVNTKGNDFFGTFTFGKTEIETTTASTSIATYTGHSKSLDEIGFEDMASVGISGGQDIYKSTYTLISKFWNLHPLEEENIETPSIETVFDYTQPSFALPSATVPLTARIVEALYSRDFLKYKPVNSVSKRPNWNNLNLDTMFKGQTIDKNLNDTSDDRNSTSKTYKGDQYVVLVLLGGITRSEISVFQYLQSKINRKILILTTGLVNNTNFLDVMY